VATVSSVSTPLKVKPLDSYGFLFIFILVMQVIHPFLAKIIMLSSTFI